MTRRVTGIDEIKVHCLRIECEAYNKVTQSIVVGEWRELCPSPGVDHHCLFDKPSDTLLMMLTSDDETE